MGRWLPLESNPEIMNKFLLGLGVPPSAVISDVYGFDAALLAMVPRPCHAVLFLYPLTDAHNAFSTEQQAKLEKEPQEVSSDVYFLKQFVSNSCGTVALIHALANSRDKVTIDDGPLKTFLEATQGMSPKDRGTALEADESFAVSHEKFAHEGQSAVPDRDETVNIHFIAFVNVGGTIYELDGRKEFPVNHGSTSDDSFLEDTGKVMQEFIQRSPEDSRYACVALTAPES